MGRVVVPPGARHVDAHVARGERPAPHLETHEAVGHAEAREIRASARRERPASSSAPRNMLPAMPEKGSRWSTRAPACRARAGFSAVDERRDEAAPKPLSMFTTPTFGAQLVSIPSSAAKPPNEAP